MTGLLGGAGSQTHKMLRLAAVVSVCFGIVLAQNSCETNRLNAVKNGSQGARGTNLGSWFVLESWMAPKPWDENGCDKGSQGGSYLLEQCLGNKATDVLEKHWSSWITESDFSEMSSRGVNLVRIPVGWWQIYDPQGGVQNTNLNWTITPRHYTVGGLKYIDKAFDWAAKHGIAVLLCMHAAPGSQNGNDHSSPAENPGQINWHKYPDNVGQTVDSMGLYAERYGKHAALYGFSLLNEPAQSDMNVLQDYYKRAYERVRQYSPNSYIILNPLISPFESGTESHWTGFMNPDQGYSKVGLDLHYYSCFGGDGDQTNPDGAINYIRYDRQGQIDDYKSKNPKGMIIGEWSACGHFDVSRAGDFAKIQVDVYGTTTYGWTFWSWTDGGNNNVWSLKTAFNQGWIPDQISC